MFIRIESYNETLLMCDHFKWYASIIPHYLKNVNRYFKKSLKKSIITEVKKCCKKYYNQI